MSIGIKWLEPSILNEFSRLIKTKYSNKELIIYVNPINGQKYPTQTCLLTITIKPKHGPQESLCINKNNRKICHIFTEANTPCKDLKRTWEQIKTKLIQDLNLNPNKHKIKLVTT